MNQNVFNSIIGYDHIKLELLRILDQLRNPEKYAALGVSEPHGLLLHGAPGVGKSTLAQCFADICGRAVFVCRKDKPNGDFVKEITRVFEEAAENTPSLVLLDDLDKFSNADERCRDAEEFVTVQTCIDRVRDKQVFVVATVNKLRKLPESLVRAGRFDHVLKMNCPAQQDAEAIIAHYLAKKPYVAELDVRRISRLLADQSCAQLETVVNQAGVYAAFDGRDRIEMKDMIKSILRVVFFAPESPCHAEKSLPLIACHEAGHALIAELREPDSVDLVTILSHDTHAAGVTSLFRDESYFHSKELMEIRVMCLLAGKAAVEICFGLTDTGCNCDLRRAFDIVHRFVDHYCAYGFNQFVVADNGSAELLDRRDSRIAAEIEHYYNKTRQLLVENRSKLDALTARLLEEKTLLGDQVKQILAA